MPGALVRRGGGLSQASRTVLRRQARSSWSEAVVDHIVVVVTARLPEQRRRAVVPRPVIHLRLETQVTAGSLGGLLNWMRCLPAADVVELAVTPFSHPAMPVAVLADIAVLTADGVCRVRGMGRTPHAAIEKLRLNYRRSS